MSLIFIERSHVIKTTYQAYDLLRLPCKLSMNVSFDSDQANYTLETERKRETANVLQVLSQDTWYKLLGQFLVCLTPN